ncbi:MAG: hypothetical protein WC371_00105 [Parachlamydiales bacterium]|jgi:hypothetical protein
MQPLELQNRLSVLFGQKIELVLKKNRTAFLRLVKQPLSFEPKEIYWRAKKPLEGKGCFKQQLVSRLDFRRVFNRICSDRSEKSFFLKIILHPVFLKAEEAELLAIKDFFLHRSYAAKQKLKVFFQNQISAEAAAPPVSEKLPKLRWEGNYYNLKNILEELNQSYFRNELKGLQITWGRRCRYWKFRHLTFGSFDHHLKLIRINPLLDHPSIPAFFLSFVVYHEMLHDLHPIMQGKKRQILHSASFLKEEKKFYFYQEAKAFRKGFFKKRKDIYGRAQ